MNLMDMFEFATKNFAFVSLFLSMLFVVWSLWTETVMFKRSSIRKSALKFSLYAFSSSIIGLIAILVLLTILSSGYILFGLPVILASGLATALFTFLLAWLSYILLVKNFIYSEITNSKKIIGLCVLAIVGVCICVLSFVVVSSYKNSGSGAQVNVIKIENK